MLVTKSNYTGSSPVQSPVPQAQWVGNRLRNNQIDCGLNPTEHLEEMRD